MISSDPFMIRAHVPDWDACVADYRSASEATRQRHADRRTVAYGPGPDESLDLYLPDPATTAANRPVHLFVHGGYWRAFSKEDYAFMADAIVAEGAVAAVMDYSLMPVARVATLVAQVRRAALWLQDNAIGFGGDPQRLSASGHSAGAHLASFLVCRAGHEPDVRLPTLRAVLLVSGIYDLDPITRSYLQPDLRLTPSEVRDWSPMRASMQDTGTGVDLLVGERETAPFQAQARAFAEHLARAGARSRLATMAGEDHMTIVREVGRPGSTCAAHLAAVIRASAAP